MKNYLLSLIFPLFMLIGAFAHAQTLAIATINGETPSDFMANNPSLAAGTALEIVVNYSNAADLGGSHNLYVRLLNEWTTIGGTYSGKVVTPGAAETTETFTITVPSMNPGTSAGRLQARVAKVGGGFVNSVVYPLNIAADNVEISANVSIETIQGVTPATHLANTSGALTEGEVLSIAVDYTAIKPNPNKSDAIEVGVRLLTSSYAEIPGSAVYEVVTQSDSEQSITIDLTVPDIDESLTDVRIQALGFGFNGDTDGLTYNYSNGWSIDHTTLSINMTNKDILLDAYYNGKGKIVVRGEVSGAYAVYNLLGAVVDKGTITSLIDVSSLSNGVYILSTSSGYIKFVK